MFEATWVRWASCTLGASCRRWTWSTGGQSFLSGESQCMGGCADRFHPPGGLVTVPSYTLHLGDIYANFVAILREHAFLLTRL